MIFPNNSERLAFSKLSKGLRAVERTCEDLILCMSIRIDMRCERSAIPYTCGQLWSEREPALIDGNRTQYAKNIHGCCSGRLRPAAELKGERSVIFGGEGHAILERGQLSIADIVLLQS